MRKPTVLLITLFLLTGCTEVNTTDAEDAYAYWAGTKPPSGLEITEGRYWQSAHWTTEYILYLKLKPTEKWWREFTEQNQLQIVHTTWTKPNDASPWFNPTESALKYGSSSVACDAQATFQNKHHPSKFRSLS